VNRVVLICGVAMLAGPLVVGVLINLYGLARYDALPRPWPHLLVTTSIVSLCLSLLTFAMLGGNAVAGERMDRSAEFLAYLPPTRAEVIASKATLAIGCCVIIWAVQAAVMYWWAPLVGEVPEDVIRFRDDVVPHMATTSALLFGAAWLGSTLVSSPAIATGIGFGAPWVLFAVLSVFRYALGFDDLDLGAWWFALATGLGIACFVGGTAHYVHRVEP
jgi:ABC-type transport system involved in multi-copper enzyme maturation permease subunit